MLKIRRPLGRLIFNMGITIPCKTVFLIERAPRARWIGYFSYYEKNATVATWLCEMLSVWSIHNHLQTKNINVFLIGYYFPIPEFISQYIGYYLKSPLFGKVQNVSIYVLEMHFSSSKHYQVDYMFNTCIIKSNIRLIPARKWRFSRMAKKFFDSCYMKILITTDPYIYMISYKIC